MLSREVIAHFWPDADPEDIAEQWENLQYRFKKDRETKFGKNHVTKGDCRVVTKYMGEIAIALTDYAAKGYDDAYVYGDSNVMVSLITLQNKIEEIRGRKK